MSCPSVGSVSYVQLLDNGAQGIVESGWATAQSYANSAFATSTNFIGELATVANQLADIPSISVDLADPSTVLTGISLPDAPTAPDGIALLLPAVPAEPVLGTVHELSLPDAPLFMAQLPDINLNITKPSDFSASIPLEPTLDSISVPAEPTISLPDVPTLASINLPFAPVINLPEFTAMLPDAPLALPDTTLSFTEQAYVSDLLDAVKSHLLQWVNGASTGIEPYVEQAIWDRARAREDVSSLRTLNELNRTFASRGFSIPQGALLKATMEAMQETVNKISSLSRDEAIKQADLEQSNRRFAFEQSWQVESGLITHSNQVAQRAFDVSRLILQAGIDIFVATITRYTAQMQGYGIEATVFKTRIEAELANLDVFKAQLEGQRLIGELNTQAVEIYKAKIQAVNMTIELYNSKVKAADTKASINKAIIEGFATRVQAYDSLVKSKASEYDAYATQVKAEVSKGELFKVQADAYNSQVNGYSALVNARVQENNAEIKINQELPMEMFKQKAMVFGELVKAESMRVGALADLYKTDGAVYQSIAGAQAAKVGAEAEGFKAETALIVGKSQALIEAAKSNVAKMMAEVQLLVEAIKAGAQVSAQLAASALSAVNLSGSISDGQTRSIGSSLTTSNQTSNSKSCSDIYTHKD